MARVLPDLTGLDKEFDYLVPDDWRPRCRWGRCCESRCTGGAWAAGSSSWTHVDAPATELRPIAKVSSRGPDAALIDLARWASVRWAAGRLRPFLVTASPPANVGALPPERRTKVAIEPAHRDAADLLVAGGGMLRLPPTEDVLPVLAAAARLGPLLVIVPSVDRARIDATRLRRAGLAVALGAAGVGAGGGWGRRRHRRPCRGVGTVPRPRRCRRRRRAGEVAAGGAQPDVARPRRRRRTGSPRRCPGAARLTVPDGQRAGSCGGPPAAAVDRRRAQRVADRRGRRPRAGGAVEAIARHAGVDRPPAQRRADGRVRAEHARSGTHPRLPGMPDVGPVRALRSCRRSDRRGPAGLPPLRPRASRRVPQPVERRASPTCAPV